MSTISHARPLSKRVAFVPFPVPSSVMRCITGCGRAVRVGSGFDGQAICEQCRHSQQWGDAQRLQSDVQALVCGHAPYQLLSIDERAAALQGIMQAGGEGPAMYPDLRAADDATLIAIVDDPRKHCTAIDDDPQAMLTEATAELARRLSAPTPAERDEIEQRIAAEEPDPFDLLS